MPYYIPNPNLRNETLQVFEEGYHGRNNVSGYWGPVQSSVDWCERNYVVSHYVAEWYNTVSNALMVYLAAIGILHALTARQEPRFVMLGLTLFIVGLGSAIFHGTLTHVGQQGDETPMVFALAVWTYTLYAMDPKFEHAHPDRVSALRLFLTASSLIFAVAHYYLRLVTTFQVSFCVLTWTASFMTLANILKTTNKAAVRLGTFYCAGMILAFCLWLVDVHHCEHLHQLPYGLPNPQLHAWWHAITGLCCYCGPAFLQFRRLTLLGADPVIAWRFGVPVAVARAKIPDHLHAE
jgi:dihydroceramidase